MILSVNRWFKSTAVIFSLVCSAGQIAETLAKGYPNEHLVTQRWHYLSASRSPTTNPSFINEENYFTAKYAFSKTLSAFTFHELGIVYPLGLYQSVGVQWLMQTANAFNITEGTPGDPNFKETGEMFYDNKNYFTLTYANNLWNRLTLGANVNISLNTIGSEIDKGIGIDVGLNYKLINHPVIGSHNFGIALQNALYLLGDANPRTLRFSLNSTYWERRIESGFDFGVKDIAAPTTSWPNAAAQTEWELNGKLGFWLLRFVNVYGLLSFSETGMESFGAAGGFNMPTINNGRDLSFLVNYTSQLEKGNNTITMYAKGNFGKHREEIYARAMAKRISLQPNDLYTRAVELYNQGNYWDAFFLFSQLNVEFPDFFKNDWVSFFLGSCQENLDMRTTAEEAFRKTKDQFARSAAVPFSDLGLMRVFYRDGNYSGVESQFNELNKLGVPDSIKYHGYYLMGQTALKEANSSKAKQLFSLIPETHPDYAFAQHSSAVADAVMDNMESALTSLENSIQAPAVTSAQKEIVNRSYVFLGYIFYEVLANQEGSMAKAVTAMRSIPKTSIYYSDAQLGLAWTGLKARQWADCEGAATELAATTNNPLLKSEGLLLKAYSQMMQKNYPAAVTYLTEASSSIANYTVPSESELASKKTEYQQVRSEYTQLARSAYDLGGARQSVLVIKQIDSLHIHQKNFSQKIQEYLKYQDGYDKASFFARNIEAVKEDVEYALAKAEKLAGSKSISKETEKAQEIDVELKKLKEQLEKESLKEQAE